MFLGFSVKGQRASCRSPDSDTGAGQVEAIFKPHRDKMCF